MLAWWREITKGHPLPHKVRYMLTTLIIVEDHLKGCRVFVFLSVLGLVRLLPFVGGGHLSTFSSVFVG